MYFSGFRGSLCCFGINLLFLQCSTSPIKTPCLVPAYFSLQETLHPTLLRKMEHFGYEIPKCPASIPTDAYLYALISIPFSRLQ